MKPRAEVIASGEAAGEGWGWLDPALGVRVHSLCSELLQSHPLAE